MIFIINNNHNIINNNINITINPFGKEDMSHITDANYKKYMLDIFPGFVNFITKIYYDEQMPSNHNVCIKNIKSNHGYFYDGEKWNIIDRDDLINNLISLELYNSLSQSITVKSKLSHITILIFSS